MSLAGYLTISLVIQLTVIGSQVSAFTFDRITSTDTLTDVTAAGSSNLGVRLDLSGKDVTVIDVQNEATMQKIVPIETTAKTEEIQKNYPTTENLPLSTENEHGTHEATRPEAETTGMSSEAATEFVTSSAKDRASETTSEDGTETHKVSSIENTTVTENLKSSNEESTTIQYVSLITDDTFRKSSVRSLATIISEHIMATETEENNITSYSTEPVEINETTDYPTSSTKEINGQSEETPSTTQTSLMTRQSDAGTTVSDDIDDSTTMTTELDNTDKSTTKVDQVTETLKAEYSSDTVIPYWKKYTVIDRKRVKSTVDEGLITSTERQEVMVRADTAQSSIILENSFNIPYTTPLQNLPSTRAATWSTIDTENGTETSTLEKSTGTIHIERIPSTSVTGETTRLEVLTSQRAGFLDYSLKPTATLETMTTDNEAEQTNETEKTTIFNVHENTKPTKTTSTASQSQLAEDAINEELMKEEMLNNNLAYTNQYREERFDIKNIKNIIEVEKITTTPYQGNAQPRHENSTDDKLSVKPIGADKPKNTSLYTVNPNYKPLKKLEVQPPKPFVRDPDDNSWRNESLSSLGIVFKAKNSSKPFTQVLKNKTETQLTQLTTIIDKYNKGQELELRERLEKIAEIRKSKKKKIDGETGSGDDEESNTLHENNSTPVMKINMPPKFPLQKVINIFSPSPADELTIINNNETTKPKKVTKTLEVESVTTQKPTKQINIENYDANDEDDADYVTLANIDLKKFLTPEVNSETPFTTSVPVFTQPLRQHLPERKPTIQYFPPQVPQKVNINEYDDVFQRKINEYTVKEPNKRLPPLTHTTVPTYATESVRLEQAYKQHTARPTTESPRILRPVNSDMNNYRVKEPTIGFSAENQDGGFNRASYIIKHFKDFINEAAKDSEEEKNSPYILTEAPARDNGEFIHQNRVKTNDYEDDYESQFRKDVLNRFVDNFNQNSERFKVDFPILYNTSIVHSQSAENGKASSSAFLKRLYDEAKSGGGNFVQRAYDPNCDRLVELSPEYELHYYVPEQEEREEAEPKAITIPHHRFRPRG